MNKTLLPSRNRRAVRTAVAVLLTAVVVLSACNPAATQTGPAVPPGTVRMQGAFENLVPAESIIEARNGHGSRAPAAGALNPRSLISQSASISAILSGIEDVDFEEPGVVTTTEVTEGGGFAVDVPTAAAPDGTTGDYVMLAYDEALGVGVEQLIGFIELPAGADESSAGWPLGGTAQGTTVDLGTMGGDGGDEQTIVAAGDQNTLYDVLGADQAEVLFQAQRGDFLRDVANRYLNEEAQYLLYSRWFLELDLSDAENAWMNVEASVDPDPNVAIDLVDVGNAELTLIDFLDGPSTYVVTPPEIVVTDEGEEYGPDQPFRSVDRQDQMQSRYDESPFNSPFGTSLSGAPPDGEWIVQFDGATDGVFDLGWTNPYDPEGRFLLFAPSARVNVSDVTGQIESIDLRVLTYSPLDGEYVVIEDPNLVPAELEVRLFFAPYGSAVDDADGDRLQLDLNAEIGTPVDIPTDLDVYWDEPTDGYHLEEFDVYYTLGIDYRFFLRRWSIGIGPVF